MLGVTKSTSTHHFRVLREAGVIAQQEVGTSKLTSLRREDLDAALPRPARRRARPRPPRPSPRPAVRAAAVRLRRETFPGTLDRKRRGASGGSRHERGGADTERSGANADRRRRGAVDAQPARSPERVDDRDGARVLRDARAVRGRRGRSRDHRHGRRQGLLRRRGHAAAAGARRRHAGGGRGRARAPRSRPSRCRSPSRSSPQSTARAPASASCRR